MGLWASIRRALFSAPEKRENALPMAVDASPVPEDGLHVRLAAAVKEAGLPLEVVPDTEQDGRVVRGTLHGIGVEIRYAALPASEPPCLARSFHVTHAPAFWKVVGIRRRQAVYSSHQYMWEQDPGNEDIGVRYAFLSEQDDVAGRLVRRADFHASLDALDALVPDARMTWSQQGMLMVEVSPVTEGVDGTPDPVTRDLELLAALAENFLDREMCLVDMRSDPCRVPGLERVVVSRRVRYEGTLEGVFVELWYDERAQGIGIKAWPPRRLPPHLYIRSAALPLREARGVRVSTGDLILDRALTVQVPAGEELTMRLGVDGLREQLVEVLRGHDHGHVSDGRILVIVESADPAVVEAAARQVARLAVALGEAERDEGT